MHNVIIFLLVNPALLACERSSCRSRLTDWLHPGSIQFDKSGRKRQWRRYANGKTLEQKPSIRAVYPERNDSSIMTLSILMRWVVTQTNRMIPSMTRYAAATRSRRCPRESEPLACLKFESKQRVIFPLATVAIYGLLGACRI